MDAYDKLRLVFREMAKAVVEEGTAVMHIIITEDEIAAYLIPIETWIDEGDNEDEQV